MNCRVCDSSRLELAIDLGLQPWCNNFLTADQVGQESKYPLRVVWCQDCGVAQLDHTVPKEVMFSNHTYLSGTTRTLGEHFATVARDVDDRFFRGTEGKSVLDIGSNDGTQLQRYQALGYEVLGVESCASAVESAIGAGIPTLAAFFNRETANSIGRTFNVISAAGVFFHLEELHSVTDGIRAALRDDGVFVVQFLYAKRILENVAFDQIYHEHLLYYNVRTLDGLLRRHGLELFDAYEATIHGGSIVGLAGHAGKRAPSERLLRLQAEESAAGDNELEAYLAFSKRVQHLRDVNRRYLDDAAARKQMIYGLGAPAKGTTLLNYFGVTPRQIRYLVERNPLRRGRFCPGVHIPIMIEDELASEPDIYYVLAWNFKDEILERYSHLRARNVEFYFPIDPDRNARRP